MLFRFPNRWRGSSASRRSAAGRASTPRSDSGGRSTASSAMPSATSPLTPGTPALTAAIYPVTRARQMSPARCAHPGPRMDYVIWRCWQEGIAYDPAERGPAHSLAQGGHSTTDRGGLARGGVNASASRTKQPAGPNKERQARRTPDYDDQERRRREGLLHHGHCRRPPSPGSGARSWI